MARTKASPSASPPAPATRPAHVPGGASTSGELRLCTSFSGDQALVVVGGEVDVATAPDLVRCLRALERRGPLMVVVDMHDVSFLDAAGLRGLVTAHARLQQHGGQMVPRSPSKQVRRVLEVTGLEALYRKRRP